METTPTWPPAEDDADWRPAAKYDLDNSLAVTALLDAEGRLPAWVELPPDIDTSDGDALEGVELPSRGLVTVELESTLSDTLWVVALEHPDGGYRIVVHDEYQTRFAVPLEHVSAPLTLGELVRVLDETHPDDDPDHRGIAQAFRERNAIGDAEKDELVEFVTLRSDLYPQLNEMDRARARRWAST